MILKQAGLTGVLCVMGTEIDPAVRNRITGLTAVLRDMQLPGLVEMIPSFTSLLVRYDPLVTDASAVSRAILAIERMMSPSAEETGRVIEIPVCYGGAFGPDLPYVAEHAGLTEKEVINLHANRTYPIYMLGFLPGFPYLGGLDPKLFTPRLSSPRKAIPAGSVGIGGQQTGIYPMESPGGWQLIGRTPMKLFDPSMPLPYHAGDSIRFIPVSEEEYRQEAERWRSK